MRKRWGNFLQKAMAVLLSAVLCVGLVVGAEPMGVRAEEETPSAQLRVTVLGYDGGDVNELGTVVLTDATGTKEWIPSASIKAGVITYEVKGLQANTTYWWRAYKETSHGFLAETYTLESGVSCYITTLISIWYKDGDVILDTDYRYYRSSIPVPNMIPVKEGYTFAGWVTENGGNTKFDFNQEIEQATSIYASWTKDPVEITQNEFSNALSTIVRNMPMTNDTTREEVEEYIKKEMDEYFQIDSNVSVVKFHILQEASSVYDGRLEYEVTASYETYTARSAGIRPVTDELLAPDRGWILDEAGNLTITSPEGMDNWAQYGRLEDDNVSDVKNVVIKEGVTEIPEDAFNGCSNLEAVTIPDTVTSIGDSAFSGNSSLGEVTLPPGLNDIGSGAFSDCSSLEKVVMQGETPPSVGDSVFDGCKFVEEPENSEGIVVPPGSGDAYKESAGGIFGEYIKEQAPELTQEALDSKLQEILDQLPVSNDVTLDSVVEDVKKAIDDYFQIDSVIQPGTFEITEATSREEGLVVIDLTVSYDGLSVKKEVSKTIPKLPVEQDRGWKLDEAGNLTITSPDGMADWVANGRTEVGNASEIKNVVIGDGVTEIPDNAFAGNVSLKEVILPPSLQEIGNGAFSGCSALDRVVMQGTEPPIMGDAVFDGCKFVEDNTEGIIVPEGSGDRYKAQWGDSLGGHITEKYPAVTEEDLGKKLREVFDDLVVSNETTPESVIDIIKKQIDGYFQTASQVTIAGFDLTAATSDSEGALKLAVTVKCGDDCSAKVEGTIPIAKLSPAPDRGWELDEAGNLTIKSQEGMNNWAQTGKGETGASSIKSVVIQGDVTTIPDNAFSSCNNLGAVTIPGTVTTIGNSAFAFNTLLPSVTLPPGLLSIGKEAFLGCNLLEKVVMQGSTPPSIGESVFDHCKFTDGENATRGIVVPAESVDAYKDAWGELGQLITGKHTHDYADEWKYNEGYHWHECSCGTPGNLAAHDWGDGNVIKEPTASEEGLRGYVCPICGATKTERIPATGDTPSSSGNGNQGGGTPSTSGNGNQGGGTPSTSGNGNQGGDTPSTSGNGNQGGDTPPTPTPSNPGDGTPGGGTPSNPGDGTPGGGTPSTPGDGTPGGGTPSTPGDGTPGGGTPSNPGDGTPGGGNPSTPGDGASGSIDSLMNVNTAAGNMPWTSEPKTGDGASISLYATTAMILGFTYLILLFSEKRGMTEEKKKELLSRLIGWAKYGGKLRRMLALAGIFLLLAYYHSIGKQITAEEEAGLTV